MSPKNTRVIDRVLHWISAGAILFLLTDLGFKVHSVDYRIKGAVTHKQDAIEVHFMVALVLFAILVARIIWYRYFLDKSYHLKYESVKQKIFTRLAHFSLYGILFLMMTSGVLMVINYEHSLPVFGLFDLTLPNRESSQFYFAHNWHLTFKKTIYALLFLHIVGVMYSRR